jgi:hypothetical protein
MNIQDPRALTQHKAPSEQSLFPPAAKVNNDNLKKENTKIFAWVSIPQITGRSASGAQGPSCSNTDPAGTQLNKKHSCKLN